MERCRCSGMKKLYHYPPMLILAILASIAVAAFELCAFAKYMVLNPDYYLWVIQDSKVEEAMYDEVDAYFENLAGPSQIPKEVFTKSLDKKRLGAAARSLTRNSISYIIGQTPEKPTVQYDFTQLENDITEYIETYSEANNYEKDDEYYALIDNTIKVSEEFITRHFDVMLMKRLANSGYVSTVRKVYSLISAVMLVAGVVAVTLIIFMIVIDRKHLFDMFYWIGTVAFCAGGLLLIPSFYLSYTNYFDGFFVEDESVYRAMTGVLYGITDRMTMVNMIVVGSGLVLIIFAQIIHVARVKLSKHHHHHHHDEDED